VTSVAHLERFGTRGGATGIAADQQGLRSLSHFSKMMLLIKNIVEKVVVAIDKHLPYSSGGIRVANHFAWTTGCQAFCILKVVVKTAFMNSSRNL